MKKQDIMHFFDEHKTDLICLGVGIGIGAYAMYRHHFEPICQDVSHAVLKVSGKNQAKEVETLTEWWNAAGDTPSKDGARAIQPAPIAKEAIEGLLNEIGNDENIMWSIEKL